MIPSVSAIYCKLGYKDVAAMLLCFHTRRKIWQSTRRDKSVESSEDRSVMYFLAPSILTLLPAFGAAATIPRTPQTPTRRQDSGHAAQGIAFPVDQVTLRNARVAEQYEVNIAGLILGQGGEATAFEKVNGEDWVDIKADGTISGMPNESASSVTNITIRATSASESTATIQVSIPVRKADQLLLDRLAVMSYNLWQGGSNVNNYHEKQLRFILESGADVIGLQESVDGDHATRLGKALGYGVWSTNQSASILSRYPITREYGQVSTGGGVRINLNGESEEKREINFWNAHLTAYPYGPYGFCNDDGSPQDVLDIETESGRPSQMADILDAMSTQLAGQDDVPVLLTGDTNAPSHLDWIEGLREKNCGIADFDWPTSVLPREAGLVDSYRVAHPDPVAVQGTTWSPIYPFSEGASGDPEPQDRIDFVYATKQLEVISSETVVVGQPQLPPNEADNEWTSDHAAVLTWFKLS